MKITLWHNPRCSKSRAALALLEEADGVELEIVDYQKSPPSLARLREVLAMLGTGARGLCRKGESVYATLDLAEANEAELLDAMIEHPILIERPVAIAGERAVIGRPPENVLALVKG